MFAPACRILSTAVVPIIPVWRTTEGHVLNGVGAGIIINSDGWIVTSGHMVTLISDIQSGVGPESRTKRIKGRRRKIRQKVQNFDVLFGSDTQVRVESGILHDPIDLGILKVDKLPRRSVAFPKFRRGSVEPGELLCRIGFPFTEKNLSASWDLKNQCFIINGTYPPSGFVNEALVSRFLNLRDKKDQSTGTWIETSSPGLRGQSGGPLADQKGIICGIQVNTEHYPLGFENEGRGQVLNVGRAVHVADVCGFLTAHNIPFMMEEEQ